MTLPPDQGAPATDTPTTGAPRNGAQKKSALFFLLEDMAADEGGMWGAVHEAIRGVGRTAPNPPVGAIIENSGAVVGRGFHVVAGTAHAEKVALKAAGAAAHGATCYVTLEPCAHHGKTPPCTEALLAAGVTKCIIGALDPFDQVNGRGVSDLRAAGVDVRVTADPRAASACMALIAPFRAAVTQQRPYVIAKVAATLDGQVATATGQSQWVTGAAARQLVHRVRDRVDAVLVGSGTALADDPALTVRDVEQTQPAGQPRRVVVDSALAVPASARVFAPQPHDRGAPIVLTATDADAEKRDVHTRAGRTVIAHGERAGRATASLPPLLNALVGQGIHSVLVEPGPGLLAAMLAAGVIDEVWWFTAPKILGGDGRSASSQTGRKNMAESDELGAAAHTLAVGDDVLSVFLPRFGATRPEAG